MITDLVQIRRMGEKNRPENLRFRRWIKSHNFVERQFRHAAETVQDAIDCRQCAECCRVTEVQLAERDVEHLARYMGMRPQKFLEEYTMRNKDEELILRRTEEAGCVFLEGNECTVYEARPGNCEKFPHLLRGAGSLESRMWQFVDRATYCPIVYNWMEEVKGLTNFRSSASK
jgi:Fe-S-cluster containining protein